MEDKYIYAVQGIKEGTVTLTATSKDGQFTATKEFTVTQGVDSSVYKEKLISLKIYMKTYIQLKVMLK